MLRTGQLLHSASHPTSRRRTGASLPGTLASPRTGLSPAGCPELVEQILNLPFLIERAFCPGRTRTCVRMTSQGSAVTRLQRAIANPNTSAMQIRAIARELPTVGLEDALSIVLALLEREPGSFLGLRPVGGLGSCSSGALTSSMRNWRSRRWRRLKGLWPPLARRLWPNSRSATASVACSCCQRTGWRPARAAGSRGVGDEFGGVDAPECLKTSARRWSKVTCSGLLASLFAP